MPTQVLYDVAKEFTPYLGQRYRADSDFSGEEFREDYLERVVTEAFRDDRLLVFVFDGVIGVPPSFSEEAFGGLIRKHKEWTLADIRRHIKLQSPQSPRLKPFVDLAERFMEEQAAGR